LVISYCIEGFKLGTGGNGVEEKDPESPVKGKSKSGHGMGIAVVGTQRKKEKKGEGKRCLRGYRERKDIYSLKEGRGGQASCRRGREIEFEMRKKGGEKGSRSG